MRAPAAGEDARAADDAVGVDAVDPDAVLAELGGEQPDLVGLVGLGRAVGDVVRAGEDGVLAGDVDDVAAHALLDHAPRRRLAGDEERALGHHVVLEVPVGLGGLEQRLGERQAGVVDDEVDAAEGEHGRVDRGLRPASSSVTSAATPIATSRAADLGGGGLARFAQVEVGDDDAGALGGEPVGDGLADAGAGAGDERDPGRRAASASASAASLASSSAQYSMRNFSASSIGAYVESASAPRITLIALT